MLHLVYVPVVFLAGVILSPLVRRFFYGESAKVITFAEKKISNKF